MNRAHPSRRSSLMLKALMALTGLALVAWCALHVGGNLLTLLGPELVNRYGAALHDSPVLWLQRVGLSVATLVHVSTAVALARLARRATGGRRERRWTAAGTMRLTGTLLLLLTSIHIATIYGAWHPDFVDGDVHHNLTALAQSASGAAVLVGLTALIGFHVGHGVQSAMVSFGLTARAWPRPIARAVAAVPSLFVVGFATPIAWAIVQ